MECSGKFSHQRYKFNGIQHGAFLWGSYGPMSQFNTCQDWTNYNAWGSFVLPIVVCANELQGGAQFLRNELSFTLNEEQPSKVMVDSNQSTNKGKAASKAKGIRKGKKQVGPNKGKSKVIDH